MEKRILRSPEGEGEGSGGSDAGVEGVPTVKNDAVPHTLEGAGTGAIDTSIAPATKFDPTQAVPEGVLPSELGMYKTWQDVFDGAGEMRRTLTTEQGKNKELTDKLKAAGESAEGALAAARESMVTGEEYSQVLAHFYDTGEVPGDFLKAVANQGVNVSPDELLSFFQWKKDSRAKLIEMGGDAAPEGVDFNDLLKWMGNGQSGYSENVRAGFQEMAAGGDFSWVTGVAAKYQKAIEDQSHRPALSGNRFMGGEGHSGKPAIGGDRTGFVDTAAFAAALREVDMDGNLNPGQKQARKNIIIQQRAKQRGEVVPGIS